MYRGQWQYKKALSLLLALIFIMTAVPSYAKDFKDLQGYAWAKPFIDKMTKVDIIAGYTDGTFKPNAPVTHMETLAFISRLMAPDISEKLSAKTKYKSLLNELNIKADWEVDAVSICLNRNVFSENELRNLKKLGALGKPAKRVDVAVLFARGLGLEEEAIEKGKTGALLFFTDSDFIETAKRKYVAVLYDRKIITGDDKGNFNPNDTIRRAEVAIMLSKSYDYIEDNPLEEKPTVPDSSLETVEGTIVSILSGSQKPFITILDDYGDRLGYSMDLKVTKFYVDGKASDINGLVEGQKVEIKAKKDNKEVSSIYAESLEEEYSGKIKYLYPSTYKLTLEYEKDKKTYTKEFEVDKNADIYIDDKSAYLKDVKEGDMAELKIKNSKIYEMDVISKTREIEGTLTEISKERTTYYLTIVDSKDKSHEYPVSSKAYITRNNREVNSVEDLKIKDKVYIEVEYDEIIDIDAEVVKREIEGYIVAKNEQWNRGTEIIIKDLETKKEETFVLGKDAYIKVDKRESSAYDIKLGYYVEVVVEGDEIVELYADSRSIEIPIIGKIVSINQRGLTMDISPTNINFDDELYGKEITVCVNDDTVIGEFVDLKFHEIPFSYLRRNDIVEIKGTYDGSKIIANRIIVE